MSTEEQILCELAEGKRTLRQLTDAIDVREDLIRTALITMERRGYIVLHPNPIERWNQSWSLPPEKR